MERTRRHTMQSVLQLPAEHYVLVTIIGNNNGFP